MSTDSRLRGVVATVVAMVVLSAVTVGFAGAASSGDAITLYAGQDEPVGEVTITDDGTDLTVTYATTGGWLLTETHLHVGETEADVPQTKKGNPKVGQFAYTGTHDPGVTTVTYVVPIPAGADDVVVAAHAVVYKPPVLVGGDVSSPQWASTVVTAEQGTLKNGDPVSDAARTDPDATLGAADGVFFSLGFEANNTDYAGGSTLPEAGYVVVSFDDPVANVAGDQDIVVSEITFGRESYPVESADVYVDIGGEWVLAGTTVTNQDDVNGPGTGAVGIPDTYDGQAVESVDRVLIVDVTDPANFDGSGTRGPLADAYDLDAVGATALVVEDAREETAWASGDRFVDRGNWATYVDYQVSD